MTKEELMEFLRDNLRIETEKIWGYYQENPDYLVKLYIGKELISEDYID